MKYPMERLKQEHGKHYREGTLSEFSEWFKRSGFGDMLDNPYIAGGAAVEVPLSPEGVDLTRLRGIRFRNRNGAPASLAMQVHIARGAVELRQLFDNFVRCAGHTHLPGDFRNYCDFFSARSEEHTSELQSH